MAARAGILETGQGDLAALLQAECFLSSFLSVCEDDRQRRGGLFVSIMTVSPSSAGLELS